MAVDMFLKLGDIEGESQDSKHANEIDVLAWSWGMSQSGTMHLGTGGGAGKVNVQDLSVTKFVDAATTNLLTACSKGTQYDQAILTVRKAGGDNPLEYLIITMKDVMISTLSTGGSGGEDRLTENVSLNFANVQVDYQQQDGSGAAKGGKRTYKWNIAKNAES